MTISPIDQRKGKAVSEQSQTLGSHSAMFTRAFLIIFVAFVICVADARADVCKYWYAQVDPSVEVDFEIDENNPENILKGISCLLGLEGNRSDGLFGGAIKTRVSQVFPKATVEVCALFYISYLFYGDWEHADGIALSEHGQKFQSDKTIKKAFAFYRKWLETVKKIGLEEARKRKLDPLTGSNIHWY